MSKLLLFAIFIGALFLMSFRQHQKKKKVIFFGDSITQIGAGPGGYIRLMEGLAEQAGKGDAFELVGAGISGNNVTDLFLRVEKDVLSQRPDIVVIFVGINDIWHKRLNQSGVDFVKYTQFYQALIKRLQVAQIKVVMCTPTVIGERKDQSNDQDGELNNYSNWIRYHAKINNIPCVDLRIDFLNYLLENNPQNAEKDILTNDRVHLNAKGNQLVAQSMWKVIAKM
jgi:lysophospholipase L1-like esterase